VVLSGGVRGIGAALATALAAAGANVVLLVRPTRDAVTAELLNVVDTIGTGDGECLVLPADLRDEAAVVRAVAEATAHFGGVDACLNNASALTLAGTEEVPVEAFDLMLQVNIRGAFVLTRACLPALRRSGNPHVLTVAPPLNLAPRWLGAHPPYTLSKYGMTILALGWAEEFASLGIASNCLWPERTISTGNVVHLLGDDAARFARSPAVMADAAVAVLATPAPLVTGQCLLDVDVLRGVGIADLGRYGGGEPETDLFVGG
jgi:NAD(P)-dependent dehydrogenase (short-subunit alcohol dehydrogenase family)